MSVDYDELWQRTWGELQSYGPVHRHLREQVVRLVRDLGVRTILDVGCGAGDALMAIARDGAHDLYGVDVSSEALALAKRRVPGARFAALDVQRGGLRGRFDLVMSIQVIEHLPDDEAALRTMAGMSRAFVFVSTIGGRMRPSERAIGHVRNYTREELKAKLERAGLRPLWLRGWGFPFYSPLYRTLAELLPAGPPSGEVGPVARLGGAVLYQLYRANLPGRGDILSALARVG